MAIRLPFWKYLRNKLCLLTPCDDVDEIGLTLLALTGKIAVTRNAEAAHIGAALGGAEFRDPPQGGP